MPTDNHELYRSLTRLHRAYDGLLSARQTPHQHLATAKDGLDQRWQADLTPVLTSLYWTPLQNGIDSVPTDGRKLRKFLRDTLSTGAAVAALLALLQRYQRQAVDIGGQVALRFLNLPGVFHLTNAAYLDELDQEAEDLTSLGEEDGDISLIDTTVNHLLVGIPKARQSDGNTLFLLGAMIDTWATSRSVTIERTERPRGVADGLNWTYKENGVKYMMYDVNGVGCPEICAPLDGRITPVDNPDSDLIPPKHPGCDCIWSPVTDDWTAPEEVWTGD